MYLLLKYLIFGGLVAAEKKLDMCSSLLFITKLKSSQKQNLREQDQKQNNQH